MGKIPPLAIIGIVLVLVIAVSAGAYFKLIKPKQAELAELKTELEKQEQKAAQLEDTEQELEEVTAQWLTAQVELAKLRQERGIPMSFAHPLPALFASLWPELRTDLPKAIEEWVETQGVTITSGANLPAPPSTPPSAPSNGFMHAASISLGIQGTLSEVETLYRSLDTFPRIATINSLSLVGEGGTINATVPMEVYLLVEVPPSAAKGKAKEAEAGEPPEGMPPEGMPPGMMSPEGMPPEGWRGQGMSPEGA